MLQENDGKMQKMLGFVMGKLILIQYVQSFTMILYRGPVVQLA
jgi:hypothetical protein